MFERFSGQARHVVVSAQEEARELDHNYIGTEHLLLGLLVASDSSASASLSALGYTLDGARASVEAMVGRGKASPRGHIPFTPRAKKVLELSLREALQLKHNHIGTEHILLGLVREGEGRAAQILATKHPLDRVRADVLARIESAGPARLTPGAVRRQRMRCWRWRPSSLAIRRSAATTSWRRSCNNPTVLRRRWLHRRRNRPRPAGGQTGRGQHGRHRRRHTGASRSPAARAVDNRPGRHSRAARSRLPRTRETNHQAQWRPTGEPRRAAGSTRSAMGRGQQLDGRHRPSAGIPARCLAGGCGKVVHPRTTLTVPPPENQLTTLS